MYCYFILNFFMRPLQYSFLFLLGFLTILFSYPLLFEGVLVHAQSDTDQFYVNLTVDSGISITDCADINMSPNFGLTETKATGNTTCNVKTTDIDGYTVTIKAADDPAMQNQGLGGDIADYTETVSGTPEQWSTTSGTVEFGFSAVGDDVLSGFDDSGAITSCESNLTLGTTAQGWLGLDGLTEINVASSSSPTNQSGTDVTVCTGAEQNGGFSDSGTYQANLTLTATVQ